MTLNGVVAVILRYFAEYGKHAFQHITASICHGIWCTSLLYFVLRVRCRRKEGSRSLSHLLMSFLLSIPPFVPLSLHSFLSNISLSRGPHLLKRARGSGRAVSPAAKQFWPLVSGDSSVDEVYIRQTSITSHKIHKIRDVGRPSLRWLSLTSSQSLELNIVSSVNVRSRRPTILPDGKTTVLFWERKRSDDWLSCGWVQFGAWQRQPHTWQARAKSRASLRVWFFYTTMSQNFQF